jgi:vacuolar-type H+-ATPase catalytic subunit A/Vma1
LLVCHFLFFHYYDKLFMDSMRKLIFMRGGGAMAKSQTIGFLAVGALAETKKLALRRHVWFKSLSRVERAIIDLTVRCVDNIKSAKLASVVTAIMQKLQTAMESLAERLVRTVGLSLTRKISSIAVSWGNRLASLWAEDQAFARYLAFCVVKDVGMVT